MCHCEDHGLAASLTPHTLADGSMAGPTRISTIAALVVVPAVDQIIIASGRCARRPHAVVATATDAAVVIVRAVLAAPSFVRKKGHHSAAVAAVVVAPLHLRLVDYVVAIKQQQLTVRTGFDPQACRVPTQRGIYLFSVTVSIFQVCRSCASAVSHSSHVPWLPVPCSRADCSADAHG